MSFPQPVLRRVLSIQTSINGEWKHNKDNYDQIMELINNPQTSFKCNEEIRIEFILDDNYIHTIIFRKEIEITKFNIINRIKTMVKSCRSQEEFD